MSVNVHIIGTKSNPVEVTPNGEQVVTTLAFATAQYQLLDVVNTAYNFYGPRSAQRIRFAGLVVKADRFVGANGSIVTIYESLDPDSIVEEAILFKTELAKDQILSFEVPFQAREGFFINAKCGDNNVHLTAYANFVPTPDEIDLAVS